jgi:preprotein translocase subunit SecE
MTTPVVPQQRSLPARTVQFYHDVMAEMKKVTWPDRPQLQDATIKIIIFVLFIGAIIALMDIGLQFILVRLPQLLLGR